MQVHSVEKGKVTPSNQFLEKILTEFRLNSEWVFIGEGELITQDRGIDDQLIAWLNAQPDVVRELRKRGGLD